MKFRWFSIALLLLVGCDSAASKNTGPTIEVRCLSDSSTGSKSSAIDAPTTVTQNCDKSDRSTDVAPTPAAP